MSNESRNIDGYAIFATAIGECGIAWANDRIVRLQLPEKNKTELLKRLTAPLGAAAKRQVCQSPPTPEIEETIALVKRHLAGDLQDFQNVDIDIEWCPDFHQRVYRALRMVPAGKTISYGELAAAAGSPKGSRAVGQAMARNPVPLIVPCQRVFKADGQLGGFSAYGAEKTKVRLLTIEKNESIRQSCHV